MPLRSKKPCRHFGCGGLTNGAYCAAHKAIYDEKERERLKSLRTTFDKGRPSFRKRGYNARWDKLARIYLKRNPLCVLCAKVNLTVQARQVDHIIPHEGDHDLFWHQDNWQGLCRKCHLKKTKKEANETQTY